MLTDLEYLELYMYMLDSKKLKIALCRVNFGNINLCLLSELSSFQKV